MDFLEKVANLPENVRDYFCSNDSRIAVEQACFLYNINEDEIEKITSCVKDIFFKDVALEQLPLVVSRIFLVQNAVAAGIAYELNLKMFAAFPQYFTDAAMLLEKWKQLKSPPIVSEEKAWRRVLEIEPWILEEEKEKSKQITEEQKNFNQLSLAEALVQYPKLAEQSITSSPIKLRYSPELVKPSIKNWMNDFHDAMGSMTHSAMDRGNFLFHSENGKNLSAIDRQKLGIILKSLDEKTFLNIDVEAQAVVFEENTDRPQASTSVGGIPNSRLASMSEHLRESRQVIRNPEQSMNLDSHFRGNDNVTHVQKNILPSIDLRQSFSQNANSEQRFNENDNFADNVQVNHPVQPMRQEEKVQDFFAKPVNENVENANDFFSIPGSKPPIGTDSFIAANERVIDDKNVQTMEAEKKVGIATALLGKMGFGPEQETILTEKKKMEIPAEVPLQKTEVKNEVVENQQDPNLMSDEMLYKLLQERRSKSAGLQQDANSSKGVMSFSSPQKLPAEQALKHEQAPAAKPEIAQQPAPSAAVSKISKSTVAQKQVSPYHISPLSHAAENRDGASRVQKNVVDLKN